MCVIVNERRSNVATVHVVTVTYLQSYSWCASSFKAPATFRRTHVTKHSTLTYVAHVPAAFIKCCKQRPITVTHATAATRVCEHILWMVIGRASSYLGVWTDSLCSSTTRDAPIGRLLCWYRPIVIYYVLWWHWILKLYIFFNLNGRHKFSFYSYICKLHKHAGSVVFCVVMH